MKDMITKNQSSPTRRLDLLQEHMSDVKDMVSTATAGGDEKDVFAHIFAPFFSAQNEPASARLGPEEIGQTFGQTDRLKQLAAMQYDVYAQAAGNEAIVKCLWDLRLEVARRAWTALQMVKTPFREAMKQQSREGESVREAFHQWVLAYIALHNGWTLPTQAKILSSGGYTSQ